MALMIPSDFDDFTTPGEREVYFFFQEYAKPDSKYTCWYSPDIEDREPDFVLFSRDLGLIIIEVKDWSLDKILHLDKFHAEIQTREGVKNRGNPLTQASNYLIKLKEMIQNDGTLISKNPAHHGNPKIPLNYAVVFPNINKYQFMQSRHKDQKNVDKILFGDDLDQYSPICNDSTGVCFFEAIEKICAFRLNFSISLHEYKTLKFMVFPITQVEVPERIPSDKYLDNIDRLHALEDQQESAARQIAGEHCLIKGPSGSGKTIILVHKAAFMCQHRRIFKRILFVCYNLTLVNYIKRLLANKKVPIGPGGVEIYCFYELCSKLIELEVEHENQDSQYYKDIIELSLEQASKLDEKYDAVLIDEGQDFSDEMIQVLVELLNKNTNHLTIALDKNQTIYQTKSSWRKLGVIVHRSRIDNLRTVYRSTIEISAFANKFVQKEIDAKEKHKQLEFPQFCKQLHGLQPQIEKYQNISDIVEFICNTINDKSVGDGIPLSEFAVIYASKSYSQPILSEFPTIVGKTLESKGILYDWISEDSRSKRGYDITTDRVTVSSIHSIKGLDYFTVFLVGMDSIDIGEWSDDLINKLSYVAITRARELLYIPYLRKTPLIEKLIGCM